MQILQRKAICSAQRAAWNNCSDLVRYGCVVDQDIQASIFLFQEIPQSGDAGSVADVQLMELGLEAFFL